MSSTTTGATLELNIYFQGAIRRVSVSRLTYLDEAKQCIINQVVASGYSKHLADYRLTIGGAEADETQQLTDEFLEENQIKPWVLESLATMLNVPSKAAATAVDVSVAEDDLSIRPPRCAAQTWEELILDVYPSIKDATKHHCVGIVREANTNLLPYTTGEVFPFLNRESECQQLLKVFSDMDKVRQLASADVGNRNLWDTWKRIIPVPLCIGIAGIGKSRFAREAMFLAKPTADMHKDNPSFSDRWSEAVANAVRLRIPCDEHRKCPKPTLLEEIALRLLFEFGKDADTRFTGVNAFDKFMAALRERQSSVRLFAPLTIIDALRMIALYSRGATMFVNIDEADKIVADDRVNDIIQAFGAAVLAGVPVFFTVTGLYNDDLMDATYNSGMLPRRIELPLLNDSHTASIIDSVLGEGCSESPMFRHVCYLAGAVPRMLEYCIVAAARKAGAIVMEPTLGIGRKKLVGFIQTMDAAAMRLVVNLLKDMCGDRWIPTRVPDEALQAIVAANISGSAFNSAAVLFHEAHTAWTVASLAHHQLLYHAPDKRVLTAPLYISAMHRRSVDKTSALSSLLFSLEPLSTTRDNETVLPSTLLLRLQAAHIQKKRHVALSELHVVRPDDALANFKVTVPQCFNLTRVEQTLDDLAPKFAALRALTLQHLKEFPESTSGAFINMPKANSADGYFIFPECTIFVQEKQRVASRANAVVRGSIARAYLGPDESEILAEYKKVKMNMQANDLFVFITDEHARESPTLPDDVRTVHVEDHSYVFSDVVTHLRLFAHAESMIDL